MTKHGTSAKTVSIEQVTKLVTVVEQAAASIVPKDAPLDLAKEFVHLAGQRASSICSHKLSSKIMQEILGESILVDSFKMALRIDCDEGMREALRKRDKSFPKTVNAIEAALTAHKDPLRAEVWRWQEFWKKREVVDIPESSLSLKEYEEEIKERYSAHLLFIPAGEGVTFVDHYFGSYAFLYRVVREKGPREYIKQDYEKLPARWLWLSYSLSVVKDSKEVPLSSLRPISLFEDIVFTNFMREVKGFEHLYIGDRTERSANIRCCWSVKS